MADNRASGSAAENAAREVHVAALVHRVTEGDQSALIELADIAVGSESVAPAFTDADRYLECVREALRRLEYDDVVRAAGEALGALGALAPTREILRTALDGLPLWKLDDYEDAEAVRRARAALAGVGGSPDETRVARVAACAGSPDATSFRRPRGFSPGYERHAAPESIKAYIAATRERQEEIYNELGWLEAMYLRRVAEQAAGTWPYAEGADDPAGVGEHRPDQPQTDLDETLADTGLGFIVGRPTGDLDSWIEETEDSGGAQERRAPDGETGRCPKCDGGGLAAGARDEWGFGVPCPRCDGTGLAVREQEA